MNVCAPANLRVGENLCVQVRAYARESVCVWVWVCGGGCVCVHVRLRVRVRVRVPLCMCLFTRKYMFAYIAQLP